MISLPMVRSIHIHSVRTGHYRTTIRNISTITMNSLLPSPRVAATSAQLAENPPSISFSLRYPIVRMTIHAHHCRAVSISLTETLSPTLFPLTRSYFQSFPLFLVTRLIYSVATLQRYREKTFEGKKKNFQSHLQGNLSRKPSALTLS